MNILVIGSGGREHAICWKLQQSVKVSHVYVLPGSEAIAELPKTSCVKDVNLRDFKVSKRNFHQNNNKIKIKKKQQVNLRHLRHRNQSQLLLLSRSKCTIFTMSDLISIVGRRRMVRQQCYRSRRCRARGSTRRWHR